MVDIPINYTSIDRDAAIAGLNNFNARLKQTQQALDGIGTAEGRLAKSTGLTSLGKQSEGAEVGVRSLGKELSALDAKIAALSNRKIKIESQILDKQSTFASLNAQIKSLENRKLVVQAKFFADTQAVIDLNNQIKKLGDQRIKVKADFGTASPELDKLDAKLLRLEQRKISLQANATQASSEIEKVDSKLVALSGKKIAIAADTSEAQRKLAEVNQEIAQVGSGSKGLTEVTARFQSLRDAGESNQSSFRKLNAEFGISESQFNSLRGAIKPTVAELTQLGAVSGALAAGGLVFFGSSIAEFVEANSNLVEFAALSQTSTSELGELTDESRKLAIELKGLNAADIVGAGSNLVTLGASAEEAQERLRGVAELAVAAANGDTELAGQVVQSTLNSFERLGESAGSVSDKLAALRNNSAASVEDVQFLLARSGAVAADLNVPLTELAAAFGVLRNQGQSAEVAATGLRNIISRLAAPTSGAADALKALGVDVFDSKGEFRGLNTIIGEFQKSTTQLSQEQRIGLLSEIFGKKGISAASGLIQAVDGDLLALNDTLNNSAGVAGETAAALNVGLSGALGQLVGAFSTFQEVTGESVSGVLEPFVRSATGLLSLFVALPAPIQTTLVATAGFATVLAGAVAVLTAYELLQRQVKIALVAEAAVTQLNTIATLANSVANKANLLLKQLGAAATQRYTIAQIAETAVKIRDTAVTTAAIAKDKAYAAGKLVLATLTGKANQAQVASVAASLKGVATLGLFAAAAGSVALVANTFTSITAEAGKTRDAIKAIEEDLNNLDTSDLTPEQKVQTEGEANFDKITESLNPVQRGLDVVRGAIPGISTAAEAAASRSAVAFQDLSVAVADVGLEAAKIANDIEEGIEVDPQNVATTVSAIDKSIAALKSQVLVSEDDIRAKDAQIVKLEEYKSRIANTVAGQEALTEALTTTTEKIDAMAAALARTNAGIEASGAAASAQLAAELEAGTLSYEEYENKITTVTENGLKDRISAAQSQLTNLRAAELQAVDPADKQKAADQILTIEKQLNDDRKTLSLSRVEAVKQAEEDALEAVKEAAAKQAAVIDKNVAENRKALEQFASGLDAQVDLGNLTQGQADAQVAIRGASDELGILQQRLTAAQTAAASFNGDTSERADALKDVANLEADIIAEERNASKARRELIKADEDARKEAEEKRLKAIEEREKKAIDAIKREEAAAVGSLDAQAGIAKNLADAQVNNQTRLTQTYDLSTKALDEQLSRVKSISDLISAQADLQSTISDQEISTLESALDIREKLDSGSVESAQERAALERQIGQLGLQGQSAEKIRSQLVAERVQAAEQERAALAIQQTIALQSLEIEGQKSAIANSRAIVEARIGIIQQQSAAAALESDRQRLVIQQQSLQNQLATTTDEGARQDLALAIQQNEVTLQGIEGQKVASQDLLALRQQELQTVEAAAQAEQAALARQREVLGIQQQNQRLQLANQQATEARALATDLAASGDKRAAAAAQRFAEEASRGADAEERRAQALLASSQSAQSLAAQAAATNDAFNLAGATDQTAAALTVSADTVEENLSNSALVWNDSAQSVETAFLSSAESFQTAANSLQATIAFIRLQAGAPGAIQPGAGATSLPTRRIGGPVSAGQSYQLHQNEIVYQKTPGWVFNAPQSRVIRSTAMKLAAEQMAGSFISESKAMPPGTVSVFNSLDDSERTSRLTQVTERMAFDIGELRTISRQHLLKSQANSRAIARMQSRRDSGKAATAAPPSSFPFRF